MGYASSPRARPMPRRRRPPAAARWAALALLAWPLAAPAQIPLAVPTPTPTPGAEAPAGDPYRRETPRGAFLGFVDAARKGDWTAATQYLQRPGGAGAPPGELLARQLGAVLDRAFTGDLEKLSSAPMGTLEEGLPPGFQKAGEIVVGDERVDVLLARESQAEGPGIWLVSTHTLRQVPRLYRELRVPEYQERIPAVLKRPAGPLALWQLLGFLTLFPVCFLLAWLAVWGAFRPVRNRLERSGWKGDLRLTLGRARLPLALLLALLLHRLAVPYLALPLLFRYRYSLWFGVCVAAVSSWLLFRLIDGLAGSASQRFAAAGSSAVPSITLGRRLLKGFVLLVAALVALSALGVNLTAALAGLGVGGIAFAFAARTSIENLFGGFTVLGARILRVGDSCRIGPYTGTIEDVTLFATRLRTAERSVVSIPNGTLLTREIENLSRRDRILFQHTLGLRPETTPDQVRAVLEALRKVLSEHPRIAPESARARLVRLGDAGFAIELFAHILTADGVTFLGIQEELLLKVMDAVAGAGTRLALPAQTLYLGRDAGPAAASAPVPARPPEG